MAEHLGPLELVGDRWIIGDPKRVGGSCFVLTAEGMEHHEAGALGPRAVIPWSKFVELQIRATFRARHATRTMDVLGTLGGGYLETGPSGCSVSGILRHPYELWSANYTHHERPYTGSHVLLVKSLFRKTSEARALHRLGDAEWLGSAVARIVSLPTWWGPGLSRQVSEIVEDLGT
ncbi:hypothetical protein ACFWWC_23380 [Streptomyces sp. NPDC058642]|uniref:hypothetical protein n=1 Tax=Streptomyces sp. NPDC058642 TaxID=3346572 RepID=UPI0036559DCD